MPPTISPVRGILIGDDSRISIVTMPQRLDAIYQLLDCQGIEAVPWVDGAHGYIDEDGKVMGRPLNRLATAVLQMHHLIDRRDWIAGPVVILGSAPGGYEADAPTSQLEWAQQHARP